MKRANRWMAGVSALVLAMAAGVWADEEKPDAVAVAPGELVGQVVDRQNKPIEGAEVRAWFWAKDVPVRKTDKEGRFRFADEENVQQSNTVALRFRKEGYETRFDLEWPVGKPNPAVVLGNTTYFEGRVLDPAGKPVPNASIQANGGERRTRGSVNNSCIVETTSDAEGHYRLYVEPRDYEIDVRVPGTGVAKLIQQAILEDQHRELDIPLDEGATFVARCVDHDTGRPVAGVGLWIWPGAEVDGTSDAEGILKVANLAPGEYPRVGVKAAGYTRWWSDACKNEWNRYQKLEPNRFRRNLDPLDFVVAQGMEPVTIEFERGVTVSGRVLDPDGKPVAGATVAPSMGNGNSLTGDTRFSVQTDAEGRFTDIVPAGGDFAYNFIAHDGELHEWRTWANGVKRGIKTAPGMEIKDLDLQLTRPGTVSGVVLDAFDKPVGGREIRAVSIDKSGNRYYDPTTKSNADGTFTLKFVSPGEHFVQVAPFYLNPEQALRGTSQTVAVEAGKVTDGVDLIARPD